MPAPQRPSRHRNAGHIRIIGGRWRGSRLEVADRPGLRPSSDRVRETLFNWLLPAVPGARVLDLFAGTGALGWEALSRGAASAVLGERDAALAQTLRQTAARLDAQQQAEIVAGDSLAWLAGYRGPAFDIAFLDPPFADGLWERAIAVLAPRLSAQAWVYVESPLTVSPPVPADWMLHREGRTREVRFALYRTPTGQGAATLRSKDPEPAAVSE
jgi:16S rRNA (guanine966-N2)-methyltransferase